MRSAPRSVAWMFAFTACGGGSSAMQADDVIEPPLEAGTDTPTSAEPTPGVFALTSTAFVEGGAIPDAQSCNGANTSPQLDWTAAPAGAMSFAVVLTDKSNNLVHAVIYDIPSTNTGLPADVDKVFAPPDVPGAHQTASYQANVRGYNGPCPPSIHTYEFKLTALDVAALPGASMTTTRQQAVTLIDQHALGTATLTGTYTPP